MIIVDETMSGERLRSFRIDEIHEQLTVREIIRARIWQEVQEYNASQRASVFQGLVQPCSTETRLNPFKKAFVPIDWEKQYAEALKGFERNSFFLLIADRQAESLDEVFEIDLDCEVSFVKLVPLVGG